MSLQSNNTWLIGNLIFKRVEDKNSIKETLLNVETSQLTLATIENDENKRLELQAKYERVLEAYNKEV